MVRVAFIIPYKRLKNLKTYTMSTEQKVTNDIKVPNKDLETLRIHFPQCFDKDGNFQLEKFKDNLTTKEINFSTESYGLDWLGKSYARLLASDPATTLLKADEIHNTKPENVASENILIKGDNLEVLKHLSHAYYEKVKMIYIDPPYNTGSDGFVYQDDRKFTAKELVELAGIDVEKARRILDFTRSNSNSHSAWLTFMYPRLYIAKQLLREDGVIFISIDDNEAAQLRLLMDEIFGEENFESTIIPIVNPGGRDYKQVAITNEFLFVFYKSEVTELNEISKDVKFSLFDSRGGFALRELRNRNPKFHSGNRPNLFYPFFVDPKNTINDYCPVSLTKDDKFSVTVYPYNSEGKESVWRWGKDKSYKNIVQSDLDLSQIVAKQKSDGNWNIYEKNRRETTKVKSVWDESGMRTENGTRYLRELLGQSYFDHPKPLDFIKRCVEVGSNDLEIVLDFFAGSGTTGDAVMQLNAEDGGHRKYILVQLPELIDPKKNKAAYDFVKEELGAEPTIFEITKERLIRAARKINVQLDEKSNNIALKIKNLEGEIQTEETIIEIQNLKDQIIQNETLKAQNAFQIYETTPIWEDYNLDAEELNHQISLFDESKLTADDIQVLQTTWKTYDGIPLTQALTAIDLAGYHAQYGSGKLYLLDKGFTTDHLKTLLEKIDSDKNFNPTSIITFGYHFDSKNLRELSENVKSYANKKNIDIDFIIRY